MNVRYLLYVIFNLILIVLEDSHILYFVFFSVLKEVAVLFHESGLDVFKLWVYDDLLEGGDNLVEKYFFGRGWILS